MKYILLLIFSFSSIYAQSVLKHNSLTFTNGTGFTDEISEDLPVDTIPSSITYEDYLSYIYGFNVYDLGTVNVSGGVNTNMLFGKWIGEEITTTENVFSGITGLTTEGKMGADYAGGVIYDYEQNAFSDLQIGQTLTSYSVWFRTDTNDLNQIDSYSSIDITFSPSNQLALGLQAEGGDLNIQDQFYVDSTNDRVGIGRTDPDYELHVSGDIKADSLYGIIGRIATTTYYESIPDLYVEQVNFDVVYEESFSTAGWGTNMEALAFVSFSAHVKDGATEDNLVLFILNLYKTSNYPLTGHNEILASSGAATFDADEGAQDRDFTLFAGGTLEPDTSYNLQIIGNAGSGKNGNRNGIHFNLLNISGFVYALPTD
jgi:hypothetical protein